MLDQRFFTIKEAASALRVSRAYIYVMINRGDIAVTRLGPSTKRIAERDLEALIRSRTMRTAPPNPKQNDKPDAREAA